MTMRAIIAGQGTCGLEIIEDVADVDLVLFAGEWWRVAERGGCGGAAAEA